MPDVLQTVALAGVMFIATNADDLVLLGVFFAQPGARARDIVLGQLAGIGALTAISYTAAALALAVPHTWLPWLGVVPLVIGLRWLRRSGDAEAPPAGTLAWWTVAGITMANGADNLGVYIPSFAMQSGLQKVTTGIVFLVLTLLWCGLARGAVTHPQWGPSIARLFRRIAPFVLIGIGLWIVAHHPMFGLGLGDDVVP